jgi:hypothetical protein
MKLVDKNYVRPQREISSNPEGWSREAKVLAGAFALGVAVSLTACGSGGGAGTPAVAHAAVAAAAVSVATNPSLACPAGEYNPYGMSCVPAANFQIACTMASSMGYGVGPGINGAVANANSLSGSSLPIVANPSIATAVDGTSVCQSYLLYSPSSQPSLPSQGASQLVTFPALGTQYGYSMPGQNMMNVPPLPRIAPTSAPTGAGAIQLPISVLAADSLRILSPGNSGWSSGAVAGGIPSPLACAQNSITGVVGQNEGQPEGLMLSDGTSAYFVGTQQYVQIIRYTRSLSAGFNVPVGTTGCYQLSTVAIRVARCLDTNGVAHACANPQ